MSDEIRLHKEMEAGAKAKTLLDSEPFQNALRDVRAAIIDNWENCPIRDREGAHELKLMLKLMKDLEGHMRKAVADGAFASEQLKQDKTFGQKLAERLRIA